MTSSYHTVALINLPKPKQRYDYFQRKYIPESGREKDTHFANVHWDV